MSSSRWLVLAVLMGLLLTAGVRAQLNLGGNSYFEKQLLCALDKAPCDLLGRQVKNLLPDIIGKNCQNCDRKQYQNAQRIAKHVQMKYPGMWNELVAKYSSQRV